MAKKCSNPFINVPAEPDFAAMMPELADKALPQLIKMAEKGLHEIEASDDLTWDGFFCKIGDAFRPVGRAWGFLSHFLSVSNTPAWRKVYEKHQMDVVSIGMMFSQNPNFFSRMKKMRQTPEIYDALTPTRRRILDKAIKTMEDGGAGLEDEKRLRYCEIQKRLSVLGTKFHNNHIDAIKAYSLTLKKRSEVEGLPDSLLAVAAQTAKGDAKKGPWKITLNQAVYAPFMSYSRNATAREAVYRARCALASSGKFDNQPVISEYLALSDEMAKLLGYGCYAEWSLSNKMAGSVEKVDRLISELAAASFEAGRSERNELERFAEAFGDPLSGMKIKDAPWNISYWVEKQQQVRYGYSDEELSRYFPFERVLDGLFKLAERLFGIRICEEKGASVWHKDVRFFRLYERDSKESFAAFYLDPYSRPGLKRSGAWMNDFASRCRKSDGSVRKPLAVIVCNQTVPVGKKKPVMRFAEVETLFHEFGHCLQHLLTEVDDVDASGINGIEWDAVEIASQFMENWCYEKSVITDIAQHIDSGEALPGWLFDRMLASRNYRAGTMMLRQLTFAALDMDLYARYPRFDGDTPQKVAEDNFEKYSPTPCLPEDRFLCSFGHIFSGAYSAGYYSYKWSEVLSADVFAAFEEAGLNDEDRVRETGRRYRSTFLALGGSVKPAEVFRMFRGRDASIEALLRHSGLK